MQDLTITIPFRADSDERLKNLQAVIQDLQPLGCRIIVLEVDKETKTEAMQGKCGENVEIIFQQDDSPRFHRTRHINRLLRMARTTWVGVWDADVIVPKGQIIETYRAMEREGITLAYPFDGRFVALTPSQTRAYAHDADTLKFIPQESVLGRPSYGGAYIVNREDYLRLGGENERFTGWGPEDAERYHRCLIMGRKVWRLPKGCLFHLYHPVNIENAILDDLRAEFVRECCMTREEMQKYIDASLYQGAVAPHIAPVAN